MRGDFYHQVFTALQSEAASDPQSRISIYAEDLDLEHFSGGEYEANLRQLLKAKYRDRPVGVLIAVGTEALCFVLRWRSELWPGIPVVFTMVDQPDLKRLNPPSDVTGNIIDLRLADAIKAARAVVPDLASVYIVGDAWDSQAVYHNWKEEAASVPDDLHVVQLMGLAMADLRQCVSQLPERSAIIYTSIHSDGAGVFFRSAPAVSLVAEKANRPIVVAADTLLSPGGIGGYVMVPRKIGTEAGRLALRILNGERAEDIPPTAIEAARPIFNWRQMERWGVAASDLPPDSEIRFRQPSLWERYWWQSLAVTAVILIQAALISILLHERRKRNDAEFESRSRLSELAHVGRQATAGELSSSLAHELNQPLGAILTNAETAELILKSRSPDILELKEILADIRRDDLRASEIIHRMRSFLRRAPFELRDVDLNDVIREAFEFLAVQAASRNVALYFKESPEALPIRGDAVQLQQVILNLVVNSMEAMADMPYGRAVIGRAELNGGTSAIVSISDSGPGVPSEKLIEIFDPFFTTKNLGLGIGLSIARTIVQAHKGRIWAENLAEGGAVFRLSVPLALH
ncbi:sensor histidine kinase [Bradyrhizobium sp.]|uniref:sensor histidine kinase n=1 Tax=Bradyrhizobium sp. TaxID=376 RepID=UPI002D459BDD|nr:ABC transporter substrate binding protein [Bradyrhizobium sp.]HZR77425.1 ABC transporter substrate binding protein [Bradyrhizobium sp.]